MNLKRVTDSVRDKLAKKYPKLKSLITEQGSEMPIDLVMEDWLSILNNIASYSGWEDSVPGSIEEIKQELQNQELHVPLSDKGWEKFYEALKDKKYSGVSPLERFFKEDDWNYDDHDVKQAIKNATMYAESLAEEYESGTLFM